MSVVSYIPVSTSFKYRSNTRNFKLIWKNPSLKRKVENMQQRFV